MINEETVQSKGFHAIFPIFRCKHLYGAEYDLNIDVEDVVERAFGFGTFKMRHKADPSMSIEFPCVFRIAGRMSKFNELTTEWRVKTIQVPEGPAAD